MLNERVGFGPFRVLFGTHCMSHRVTRDVTTQGGPKKSEASLIDHIKPS